MKKYLQWGMAGLLGLGVAALVYAAESALPWNLQKSSMIVGSTVQNAQGENLGKIEELVVDPGDNRVVYAVVSFGGFLGIGEKWFAIPMSAMTRGQAENIFILAVDKDRLQHAPGFDKDKWPVTADRQWVSNVYAYYQQPVYWKQSAAIEASVEDSGERLILRTVDNQTIQLAVPKETLDTLTVGDKVQIIIREP